MLSYLNEILIHQTIEKTFISTLPIFLEDLESEEGKIIYANHKMEVLFGYEMLGELVGKSVEELIPPNRREIHKKHRLTYQQNPEALVMGRRVPLVGWHKKGYEFPVEIVLLPTMIEMPERKACAVGIVFDLHGRQGSHGTS